MKAMIKDIQMVDLKGQLNHIKKEVDQAIQQCLSKGDFINGGFVKQFEEELKTYTGSKYVIACANGTDALQIALMALDLQPGDEVILPAFTYVATAEVIALLQLKPVLIEVHPDTFNINENEIEALIGPNTKAIVPVHLFGQCANMEAILAIASKHKLYVIEDTAQAIGSKYQFKNGQVKQAGTMGTIGTTSFFPSKNLGCFGDGGAIFTQDEALAKRIRMVANHGQEQKYYHDIVGVNSRLDTIQAGILSVKLKHLDRYEASRNQAAKEYDIQLKGIKGIEIPTRSSSSTHVFHQYTLKVPVEHRDALKTYLQEHGIPSMVYYPLPLHHQKAYKESIVPAKGLQISELLSKSVLSLPMHTEMDKETQDYICSTIKTYFNA
jgi:UDP-2-acetamido-2-deoxy-ribo-hexuluronate aminotransferase